MAAFSGDQMRKLALTEPFMTGADVKAAQRVLHDNRFKINFHPGKLDSQYGPKAADATRLAKFLLGYPEAEVNGEFGPNLYGYLVAKGPLDTGSARARSWPRAPRAGACSSPITASASGW